MRESCLSQARNQELLLHNYASKRIVIYVQRGIRVSIKTLAQAPQELRGRNLLTSAEFSEPELEALLGYALYLKELAIHPPVLAHRQIALIFGKPSTRTRVSFEVAVSQLSGHPLVLHAQEMQLGRGESIPDTARVLGRMVDAIVIRTHAHADVEGLAQYANIPVVNALTDLDHPCQALADMLTLQEHFGFLRGLNLTYVGDGNNVAHALMLMGAVLGLNVRVATPPEARPKAVISERARALANISGAHLEVGSDVPQLVAGAQVIYTDTWVSMGEGAGKDLKAFAPFQVNAAMMALAAPDAVFMHCLPAHRGEEVTAEVIEGPASLVFDQAENRLHAQRALLAALLP